MSLGYYRLIKGRLAVRERQSPDGDSMRFIADDMSLFEGLPHYAPATQTAGIESYQLRFQAIDTPELHYGGAAQPHGLESRNGFLQWLGVDSSAWNWVVAPRGFSWETEAAVLCDGFEGHGRPIAFVLKGLDRDDGSDVKLSRQILEQTYNYQAVKAGNAYLGLYSGGLSSAVQSALLGAYREARGERAGIWKLDRTRRFSVSTLEDLEPERGSLIYPKIFRRCVDGLRWAGGQFEPGGDIDDFLKASPGENDQFYAHLTYGGRIKSRLSEVMEQINSQIRIDVDLNTVEFVSK